MKYTARHLQKLVKLGDKSAELEASDEDLELLVEILRDLQKCRKILVFLRNEYHLDLKLTPAKFHQLLELREIDIIETPTKMGDVDRVSLKDTRQPDDPVSAANLNTVLRELNQDLVRLQERSSRDFEKLLLASDICAEYISITFDTVKQLRGINHRWMGYLFCGGKARFFEAEFKNRFPNCPEAHPLKKTLDAVEAELGFYQNCDSINCKWNALSLDVFLMIHNGGMAQPLQNIQEIGSLLWNVVYNSHHLKSSFDILGIWFGDIQTLFANDRLVE